MMLFQTTDWETIAPDEHKGETGIAIWRTVKSDGIRLRLVDFSPNYKADHWCDKGHIIYCIEGDCILHLRNSGKYVLTKGMSCKIHDDAENPHLMISDTGCKLFIVDGSFLV